MPPRRSTRRKSTPPAPPPAKRRRATCEADVAEQVREGDAWVASALGWASASSSGHANPRDAASATTTTTRTTTPPEEEEASASFEEEAAAVSPHPSPRTRTQLLIAVISSKRASNVERTEWRLFANGSVCPSRVVWIVGDGEAEAYRAAGARGRVLEGGALCQSRNLAIDEARRLRCSHVLQLSDDLKKVEIVKSRGDTFGLSAFHDASTWNKPATLKDANRVGMDKIEVSPATAARLIVDVMRATRSRLGGAYVTANPGLASGMPPTTLTHFVVGDFTVIDVSSPLRYDERFLLKEDYDLTAQHLKRYGKAARCNRVLCDFEHYTNKGGAVDVRNDATEQFVIQLLHHKWPGCFRRHGTRGPNEVLFVWDRRDASLGGARAVDPTPLPDGCAPDIQEDQESRHDDDDDDAPYGQENDSQAPQPVLRSRARAPAFGPGVLPGAGGPVPAADLSVRTESPRPPPPGVGLPASSSSSSSA